MKFIYSLQIVVWYFKGLLWTFFSVHAYDIQGDLVVLSLEQALNKNFDG